jgi:hypothetical protein
VHDEAFGGGISLTRRSSATTFDAITTPPPSAPHSAWVSSRVRSLLAEGVAAGPEGRLARLLAGLAAPRCSRRGLKRRREGPAAAWGSGERAERAIIG